MSAEIDLTTLLIRQLWQFSLVLLVIGAVARLVGKRHPHLGYLLWMVVLAKAITPPIWMSNLSLFHDSAIDTHSPFYRVEAAVEATIDRDSLPATPVLASPELLNASATADQRLIPTIDSDFLLNLWLAGAAGLALLAGVAIGLRWKTLGRTQVATPAALRELVAELTETVGVRRRVEVLVTSENYGPALLGLRQPTIVLPHCLVENQDWQACRPFLLHELVHLRRGDHWVAALQSLVQLLWWFHPLVWWMNRHVVEVRERCCDRETVGLLEGDSKRYANCLLEVLEAKQRLKPLYGVPGVRAGHVTTHRIQEIMTMSTNLLRQTPSWNWLIAFVVAIMVLPGLPEVQDTVASAQATQAEPPSQPRRLMYGDGKPDGKKSIAGAGEMICFELVGDTAEISAIRVHGSRYGNPQPPQEDVEITILNEDMTDTLHTELVPYSLFKRTSKPRWNQVPFKESVEVPKKFWVVLNFNAERTKGVYVSYDTSTKGEHSRVGLTDEDAKPTDFKGDWMVQVLLAKQ